MTNSRIWEGSSPADPRPGRSDDLGRLRAIVQVLVYEHGAVPQVSFTDETVLGPEAHPSLIAAVVREAKAELETWR